MGYAISWLAIKGKTSEALVRELELTRTGDVVECGESMFTGRFLPSGWFLLVINECEHRFVAPKSFAALSNNGEVVACSIEEHAMICTVERWLDGSRVWRIEHDAQQGIDHLSTSGHLPEGYAEIKTEFTDRHEKAGGRKAETDYIFEIPLQTARSIVGFKHDENDLDDESFEVFKGAASESLPRETATQGKRPWWKLWR